MTGLAPEQLELYARGRERALQRARSSGDAFFSFVMVDPEDPANPERIRAAEHQALAFDFCAAHDFAVLQWPTDTGKSLFTCALTLYALGQDPGLSVLLVGKSEDIAQRPFRVIRQYLENPNLNVRVRSVFPHLVPSEEPGNPWTDSSLTIERPAGGADPSVRSVGLWSEYQGGKVGLYLADDLLDDENCSTDYQRKKLHRAFFGRLHSRRRPRDSRGYVINVPWDKDDQTFRLMRPRKDGGDGWPGLRMDVHGNVQLVNTDWTSLRLRPSRIKRGRGDAWEGIEHAPWYRLTAHDPDPKERTPLFPVRWDAEAIARAKQDETPAEFSRSREINPLAPEEARCERAWIVGGTDSRGRVCPGCLARGTEPITELDVEQFGRIQVEIGMDVSTGEADDESSLIPIAPLADGRVALLNVEAGKWQGPEQAERAIDAARRYEANITVESNGYQKTLRQWVVLLDDSLTTRVHALHTDDKNKKSQLFGIEAIFGEMLRGEWVIPADEDGRCEPEIEALIQECVDYRPGQHVGDRLMGLFVARARAHGRITAFRKARRPAAPRDKRPASALDLSRLNPERWRGRARNGSNGNGGYSTRNSGGF